jgi:hypothetical protein
MYVYIKKVLLTASVQVYYNFKYSILKFEIFQCFIFLLNNWATVKKPTNIYITMSGHSEKVVHLKTNMT